MEKKYLSLLLIVLLLLIGGLVAETSLGTSRFLLFTIIIYLIFFLFAKKQFHSITMITIGILILGIVSIISIINNPNEPDYLLMIFTFFSYSSILSIILFLFHVYDKSVKTRELLSRELALSKRYIDNNHTVFTYNELMDRREYLTQSCKYNSEKYCIVTIGVKDTTAVTYKAIQHLLKTTLLETVVIPKFDLLGQDETGRFVLFLQNCNKTKADKRIAEYLKILKEKADIKSDLLYLDINEGE